MVVSSLQFVHERLEILFLHHLARESRGTSIALNVIMAIAWCACAAKPFLMEQTVWGCIALCCMVVMVITHFVAAYELAVHPEWRHQAIKGRTFLYNLLGSMVVTILLKPNQLSIRHPTSFSLIHGSVIVFGQCPLSMAHNMYANAQLATLFVTIGAWLEGSSQQILLVLLGNLIFGWGLPMVFHYYLEKCARKEFLQKLSLH
eukprot:jgi/Botrbrau1/17671/Bobra.0166s0097.1